MVFFINKEDTFCKLEHLITQEKSYQSSSILCVDGPLVGLDFCLLSGSSVGPHMETFEFVSLFCPHVLPCQVLCFNNHSVDTVIINRGIITVLLTGYCETRGFGALRTLLKKLYRLNQQCLCSWNIYWGKTPNSLCLMASSYFAALVPAFILRCVQKQMVIY